MISFERKEAEQPLNRAITILKNGGTIIDVSRQEPQTYVLYRNGLLAYQATICEDERRPPIIELFYGPPECGKSRSARLGLDGTRLRFRLDYATKLLGGGGWFDGFSGQQYFLFEDFDGAASHLSLVALLQVLDRYYLDVQIKGGIVLWNPRVIRITTNRHPNEWYDYSERQEQRAALIRRFDAIHYWAADERRGYARLPPRQVGSIEEYSEMIKWDQFWSGPPTDKHMILDGDRLASRALTPQESALAKYDYMFE